MRLLCLKKSERGLRRVGDVAREWGNMAKHFTAHKAVVACVSGEDVARIVARMARIVARMARIAKFGYRRFFSQIEYKSRGASTKDKEIGCRRESRAERLKVLTRVDR